MKFIEHIENTPFIVLGILNGTFLLNLEKDNDNAWDYFLGFFLKKINNFKIS